jgi:hypothetical protein
MHKAAFDFLAWFYSGGASGNRGSNEAGGDDGTRSSDGDETGGNGEWVDQSDGDVDLDNNTVTIYGDGYWDLGSRSLLVDTNVQTSIGAIIKAARGAIVAPKKDQYGISCAELFSGKALQFLDAYEKSIGKGGALRFDDKNADGDRFSSAHYGHTSRTKSEKVAGEKYSVITFNTSSPLYNSNTFGFSGASARAFGHLSFVEFWAAALLHEIGHSVRNKFGDDPQKGGLIDPDGNDADRSRANQKFVVDTCFPKP